MMRDSLTSFDDLSRRSERLSEFKEPEKKRAESSDEDDQAKEDENIWQKMGNFFFFGCGGGKDQ